MLNFQSDVVPRKNGLLAREGDWPDRIFDRRIELETAVIKQARHPLASLIIPRGRRTAACNRALHYIHREFCLFPKTAQLCWPLLELGLSSFVVGANLHAHSARTPVRGFRLSEGL